MRACISLQAAVVGLITHAYVRVSNDMLGRMHGLQYKLHSKYMFIHIAQELHHGVYGGSCMMHASYPSSGVNV